MTAASEQRIRDSLSAAEDVPDPLDGLVARATSDPGAPFEPDVLTALVARKRANPGGFERLRAELKSCGVRVTALDKAMQGLDKEAGSGGSGGDRKPRQADILLAIAASAKLFHTPDGTGYADLQINGHRETWLIRGKIFKRWLAHRFYEDMDGAPSSEALHSALNVIEARAQFDSPEREIYIRVAGHDGCLYLDLVDETWRVVEIGPGSWRVIDEPPVRFRRAAGMKPLPVPEKGGSIELLRKFLNVQSDEDFMLIVGWILAALRNRGPYPVLALGGEQGSAKSTLLRLMRELIDPNTAPLRALSRSDRDLFIAATNGHLLCFDNVSGLAPWMSDDLCRLATGGGFAVRQLYTDQEETLFDATRPVVLNGIEDVVTRPDLADRAIILTLQPIPDERRKAEQEFLSSFELERPRILGALLDAVAHGLKMLPKIRLKRLPRMADFALWVTACETAMWSSGTFLSAYTGNLDDAVDTLIDGDPVACAVRSRIAAHSRWAGTATDLLNLFENEVPEVVRKSKTWPKTPRAVSGRLRRVAPFLRKTGIQIDFAKAGRSSARIITIFNAPESHNNRPSAPSATSGGSLKSLVGADAQETGAARTDANARNPNDESSSTVRSDAHGGVDTNGADDTDANVPNQSNRWNTSI